MQKAKDAFEGLKNIVQSAVNWVIGRANAMIASINSAAQAAASKVGLSAPQIPSIPMLADGGIVTKPTLAIIGEAGPEAVVPLSKMGSMGGGMDTMRISILEGATVNVTNEADENRLVQKISRELANVLQSQRRGLATQY